MNTDIKHFFDPLLNQAAWSVRQTNGSCFFMEFGSPHRVVREPLPTREGMSKEYALNCKRRKISFRGDWSLLVYASSWSLQTWDFFANNVSTPSEMTLPFEALDGQYIKSVHYDSSSKTTTLVFDLGGELRLWPDEDVDALDAQWSLCSIDGVYKNFLCSGEVVVERGSET